jgi:hypothetical protein
MYILLLLLSNGLAKALARLQINTQQQNNCWTLCSLRGRSLIKKKLDDQSYPELLAKNKENGQKISRNYGYLK